MFKKQEFIKSVFNLDDLPKDQLPAVILCGRSNVGKSSFINCLFNRKNLAKISSTPGKTRSINYYLIDNKFYLIDLPGYGYAKVSKKEREQWGKLINKFILSSNNIKYAFHFLDCRLNPTELDISLNELLNYCKIDYAIILNKIDKLKQSELAQAKKNIKTIFPNLIENENFYLFSSVKKKGQRKILSLLSNLFYF